MTLTLSTGTRIAHGCQAPVVASVVAMTFALPLGWTGSFDDETSVLHLATGDTTRAASVSFGAPPERSGGGLLDRATGFLETETHRLARLSWQRSQGRLPVGASRWSTRDRPVPAKWRTAKRPGTGAAIARVRSRSVAAPTGSATGPAGARWSTSTVRRSPYSPDGCCRDATARSTARFCPACRPRPSHEPDQLVVVLAASVMGPPGRTGFWGELVGELSP